MSDLCVTKKLPAMTMAQLVYGVPAPRRPRLPTRIIFVAALLGMTLGCATVRPVVEVETVGVLTASATHVTSQPVHATTDFGHAQIVETADDASEVATTVARAPEAAELPEVAPKTDGVKLGEVR